MFELIAAFGFLGTYQVVTAVFSAVRTKLIAILLGPNGVGIFSQAKTLQTIAWFLVTLGLQDGIVNLIAEANAQGDRDKQKRIVATVSFIFVVLGGIALILCWFFRNSLSEWIFGDETYNDLILLVGVSVFLFAQYMLMLNVFRGRLKWKLYATVAIVSYAVGIGISSIFIWVFGLRGAVFSLVITQVTGLIFGLFFMKLPVRKELIGNILPDWRVIEALLKYVGPLFGRKIIPLVANIYIRGMIITHLGADQSGIYHVLYAVSDVYFWAIVRPVVAYSMPKAATLVNDRKAIVDVQNNGIRLGLLGIFPIVTLVYGLREIWIPVFFSYEFLDAGFLLLWWLLGDVFRAIWVILNIDIIPLGRLNFLFFSSVITHGGLILFTVPFMPHMGLKIVAAGYLMINIITFLISFIYHLRSTDFRLTTDNIVLLVKASVILSIALWFSHFTEMNVVRLLVIVLILFVMFAGLLKSSERQFVFSFVHQKILDVLRYSKDKKAR